MSSFGCQVRETYPYSTYGAMWDVLATQLADTLDASRLPSLACPDCAAYDERAAAGDGSPYQSVPFDVTVTPLTRVGSEASNPDENPMFPKLNGTRRRFFSRPNVVLVGPLITQQVVVGTGMDHAPRASQPDDDSRLLTTHSS